MMYMEHRVLLQEFIQDFHFVETRIKASGSREKNWDL